MQIIHSLPFPFDIETKVILKATNEANKALAELKGVAQTIPNEDILLNTLVLQEAKDSSAIENIITTHDEVFKAHLFSDLVSTQAKEVMRYEKALRQGYELVKQYDMLTLNHIVAIQSTLEVSNAGFRKLPGTQLKNDLTGEVIYTPPQHHDEIVRLMSNLEQYINDGIESDVDPLVKMAIIHHQFESIHPFYDGNGRTRRIINILYLCLKNLLDNPILYLSRYIIQTKSDYYRLLSQINKADDAYLQTSWEEWVLYVLKGVTETATETIELIKGIRQLMRAYKLAIQERHPKIYSKDLLENLFKHPYTKIEYLQADLNISYATARNYLNKLCEDQFVEKHPIGKHNYYLNPPLWNLFTER